MVVVVPPPAATALDRHVVEQAVAGALSMAAHQGITGAEVTPFLLAAVAAATGGATLAANLDLLEHNAQVAGELALQLTRS